MAISTPKTWCGPFNCQKITIKSIWLSIRVNFSKSRMTKIHLPSLSISHQCCLMLPRRCLAKIESSLQTQSQHSPMYTHLVIRGNMKSTWRTSAHWPERARRCTLLQQPHACRVQCNPESAYAHDHHSEPFTHSSEFSVTFCRPEKRLETKVTPCFAACSSSILEALAV